MEVLKKIGAFALAAIGAISGLITIAGAFGIQMTGFFGWVELNSVWILPISLFFCGMIIGWSIRNGQAKRERESIEGTLGMTVEEAEERLKRIPDLESDSASLADLKADRDDLAERISLFDEDLNQDEERFLSLPGKVQSFCMSGITGNVSKTREALDGFWGRDSVEAGIESGFVVLNDNGRDEYLVWSTPRLRRLVKDRPHLMKMEFARSMRDMTDIFDYRWQDVHAIEIEGDIRAVGIDPVMDDDYYETVDRMKEQKESE